MNPKKDSHRDRKRVSKAENRVNSLALSFDRIDENCLHNGVFMDNNFIKYRIIVECM